MKRFAAFTLAFSIAAQPVAHPYTNEQLLALETEYGSVYDKQLGSKACDTAIKFIKNRLSSALPALKEKITEARENKSIAEQTFGSAKSSEARAFLQKTGVQNTVIMKNAFNGSVDDLRKMTAFGKQGYYFACIEMVPAINRQIDDYLDAGLKIDTKNAKLNSDYEVTATKAFKVIWDAERAKRR
jgi:hypothetical protein